MAEFILDIEIEHAKNISGAFDVYIKKLERTFSVSILERSEGIKITGSDLDVTTVKNILTELYELSKRGNVITEQNVDYAIAMAIENKNNALLEIDADLICHTMLGKPVKPKTLGQKQYVDAIRNNMITFGIGPAGTGKTYLAMAMAITAFKNEEVSRIILTRPAIEAGKKNCLG